MWINGSRTYPGQYRDVTAKLRLRKTDPPKAELEAQDVILTPAQLRALMAWLRQHEPIIYVWAVLQGYAGLRMLEGCYLRE